MTHEDAVELIAGGSESGRIATWADLGSGDGVFTRALAASLAPRSTIHAIDLERSVLRSIPSAHLGVRIETHVGDFTSTPWSFGRVDGILMANALHFVPEQEAFLRECAEQLSPGGRVLIVEYDTDRPNPWVPHPLSRRSLTTLLTAAGFRTIVPLGTRPSVYQRAALYAVAARLAGR